MAAGQHHGHRDLGQIEFFLNSEPEKFCRALIEVLPDPAPDRINLFPLSKQGLGIRPGDRLWLAEKLLVNPAPRSHLPQEIDALAAGNREEPGREAMTWLETPQAGMDLEKGPLGHILGVFPISQLLLVKAQDPWLIA